MPLIPTSATAALPHDDDPANAPSVASPHPRDIIFANQQLWLDRLATGLPYPRLPGRTPPPQPPTVVARLWRDEALAVARTGSSGVVMAVGAPATAITPRSIDRVLAWLRTRGTGDVLVWAPTPLPELERMLLARGARDSFAPHWMWRPLARPMPTFTPPVNIEIRLATPADREEILANPAIPYLDSDQLATMLALGESTPDSTGPVIRVVIARESGLLRRSRIVGMGAVNLDDHGTSERPIAANLFNLGVDPEARGRGIGTALTLAALAVARQDGAIGLGLNATPDGERVYRKLGFHSVGSGATWFLPGARLRHLPDAATIVFAEALAQGDLAALDPDLATIPMLPNGESPVVFAARFDASTPARDTVRWLLRRDAMPDIVALWTVGLRDEAMALMHDPRFRDRRAGERATTPLHDAIEHDDIDLARALIEAGADRTIRDTQYQGTAADWAHALHRPAIAALLTDSESQRPS